MGPYSVISQHIAVSRMYSFCQACFPNLQIWVEADDPTALAFWKEHLTRQKDVSEDTKDAVEHRMGLQKMDTMLEEDKPAY